MFTSPGDLVRVEVKKLGRIPGCGGRKVPARAAGKRNRLSGTG